MGIEKFYTTDRVVLCLFWQFQRVIETALTLGSLKNIINISNDKRS